MAQEHPTIHQNPWEYTFEVPRLDVQKDFRTQPPGTFSRLSGVDGRYAGRIRRFPGFSRVYPTEMFPATIGGFAYTVGGATQTFFKFFTITRGPYSSDRLRGFVFLGRSALGGATQRDVLFVIFSVEGATIASAVLLEAGAEGGTGLAFRHLDVTPDHQLLVIVGETTHSSPVSSKVESFARYCGSTGGWKTLSWTFDATGFSVGFNSVFPPVRTIITGQLRSFSVDVNHFLEQRKKYGLCYRILFPDQGYVGPISIPVETVSSSDGFDTQSSGAFFTHPVLPAAFGDVFTRCVVQTFRTVESESQFADQLGILHLESEWEIPRQTGALTGVTSSFNAANSWTALSTGNSAGSITGVSLGDVIYLFYGPGGGGSAGFISQLTGLVFRRRVTALDAGNEKITWDEPIPVDEAGSLRRLNWCVSKVGGEADTTGSFQLERTGFSLVRVFWGYNNRVLAIPTSNNANINDAPRGYSDAALVQAPQVDPEEFSILFKSNPRTRLIQEYENLLVRVTSPSNAEGTSENDVIRWDFVDRDRKGLLPVLNKRRLPDLSDKVVNLIKADPFLAVFLQNSFLRIHRSGSRLAVDVFHNQHGAVGRYGIVAFGTNVYAVSPVGILLADLTTGQIDVLGATQHFFDETGRWRNDLEFIKAGYDPQLGALMFLNPVKSEMLLLWLNYGVMSHLVDVPFSDMTMGVDIRTGGLKRILFLESSISTNVGVYEADAGRTGLSRTTIAHKTTTGGNPIAFNGVVLSATASSITWTSATYGRPDADQAGHFVRILDANGNPKGDPRRIASVSSGSPASSVTISGTFSSIPIAGDRFALCGIPLRMTLWPFNDPSSPIPNMFRVMTTRAIGAFIANLFGDTGAANPNLKLRYQLFSRDENTPLQVGTAALDTGKEGVIDAVSNENTFVSLEQFQPVLVPGVECWASNLDLDLLGLTVMGTVGWSKAK